MAYSVLPPPKPKNYLVESILVTLVCCLPLGIVGILMALNSDNAYARGNYAVAQENANKAKQFALWGAISYVVLVLGVIIVAVVMAALGAGKKYEQEPMPSPGFEVTRSLKEMGTELPKLN